MYCIRKVTDDLLWIGGNDRQSPLFESAHPVPRGMSYNSYLLLDEADVYEGEGVVLYADRVEQTDAPEDPLVYFR